MSAEEQSFPPPYGQRTPSHPSAGRETKIQEQESMIFVTLYSPDLFFLLSSPNHQHPQNRVRLLCSLTYFTATCVDFHIPYCGLPGLKSSSLAPTHTPHVLHTCLSYCVLWKLDPHCHDACWFFSSWGSGKWCGVEIRVSGPELNGRAPISV